MEKRIGGRPLSQVSHFNPLFSIIFHPFSLAERGGMDVQNFKSSPLKPQCMKASNKKKMCS